MGGKRPDQHNIDPGDSGASDHKNLPQTGRGKSNLDDTVNLDRQKFERSRNEARSNQAFLPDVPSPSAEANRAAHPKQIEAEEQGDVEEEPGT
jgi:hypothetical protein